MPITEREYWRARREWAFQHTELWTKGKFVTGPIVGIVAFLLQGWLGLRLIAATFQPNRHADRGLLHRGPGSANRQLDLLRSSRA
jgi:hypothetical protein